MIDMDVSAIDALNSVKFRIVNMRFELASLITDFCDQVNESTGTFPMLRFKLLVCEDKALQDYKRSFCKWFLEIEQDIDELASVFVPDAKQHWVASLQQLEEEAIKLERLIQPGVLRAVWEVSCLGLDK